MKLTSLYQSANGNDIEIEVEYDPKENVVDHIISITAVDLRKNQRIDITDMMVQYFDADSVVDSTNWRMLYAGQRPDAIGL